MNSNEHTDMHIRNKELEMIIDSSIDEIFVTNGEGVVLRVNPAGEALYGMKAKEIIGKNTLDLSRNGLYSPSIYPIVIERKASVSMLQRTKSGKTIHVIGNPVLDAYGNIELIIFTSRDLTEIKLMRDNIERTEHLLKPFQEEQQELRKCQSPASLDFISFAPNMRKIIKMVDKIALVDSTILLTGKTGVGKGVIAATIHKKSNRKFHPFIEVSCGAIPENLFESELFGYEPGAFTGANKDGKKGLLEEANGGTLFLDEIGEMPLNLQVKLLKVIQEKMIQRIGSTKTISIDIRIIAATHKNLEMMIEQGTFREDLFYRLNVIPILIPSLKTRQEDISYLIEFFFTKFNKKHHSSVHLSFEAENAFMNYDWPGNVRELENLIERLVVISDHQEIKLTDLPNQIIQNKPINKRTQYTIHVDQICTLKQAQEDVEEQLIRMAYERYQSSYKVAEALGINQSTAFRKMQKHLKLHS
ncbi:sigma-54 interaction domain-containing protein [Cytobacillus purgationiresistens]|uniref:HTH-type transcriptional regulatory protein TyrR n=1 Tax=Cytobacillus purgationiresistens TaxID=863449 RepID=A0ABU0AQF9_9BACI|nr:sigma 54-interacting transcriptional regulator [Cytobacillus purgationiresistens]MDQ0273255.1 PAS domain S-box-containing protein [Cytobacillus purgationiresistens]